MTTKVFVSTVIAISFSFSGCSRHNKAAEISIGHGVDHFMPPGPGSTSNAAVRFAMDTGADVKQGGEPQAQNVFFAPTGSAPMGQAQGPLAFQLPMGSPAANEGYGLQGQQFLAVNPASNQVQQGQVAFAQGYGQQFRSSHVVAQQQVIGLNGPGPAAGQLQMAQQTAATERARLQWLQSQDAALASQLQQLIAQRSAVRSAVEQQQRTAMGAYASVQNFRALALAQYHSMRVQQTQQITQQLNTYQQAVAVPADMPLIASFPIAPPPTFAAAPPAYGLSMLVGQNSALSSSYSQMVQASELSSVNCVQMEAGFSQDAGFQFALPPAQGTAYQAKMTMTVAKTEHHLLLATSRKTSANGFEVLSMTAMCRDEKFYSFSFDCPETLNGQRTIPAILQASADRRTHRHGLAVAVLKVLCHSYSLAKALQSASPQQRCLAAEWSQVAQMQSGAIKSESKRFARALADPKGHWAWESLWNRRACFGINMDHCKL